MDFFNSLLKKLEKRDDTQQTSQPYAGEPGEVPLPSVKPEVADRKLAAISIEDLSAQLQYGKQLLISAANPFDREYYKGVVATLEHLLQNLNFNQDVLRRYLQYAEQNGSLAAQSLEREYFKGVIATLQHLQTETLKQV